MPDSQNQKTFHLSLNVSDLNRAVEFYKRALGVEPAKHHPDYAKFELAEPPLVLSLEPGRANGQEKLNHFGIRVGSGDALRTFAEGAHAAGLEPQFLQGVECCYSRQTKICLNDPDGNMVEFYLVEEDLDHARANQAPRAEATASPAATAAFDHLLGTPFPGRIPGDDHSYDEVRLRGTFNQKKSPEETMAIFSEARRALKPGGEVMLHLLVSDKPVTKALPRLPGPAALVEHTPTEAELLRLLEEAGFHGIAVKRLSHSAVFQFDGAQMRELMVTARPKASAVPGPEQTVVYKGPFRELTDDYGNRFVRGNRTAVNAEAFAALNTPSYADQFVFLNEAPGGTC